MVLTSRYGAGRMGDAHAMGVMATAHELLVALHAIGAINRLPTASEEAAMLAATDGEAVWRLTCTHHLAGAVETQVLMAAGAAADAGAKSTAILQSGWELYAGARIDEDGARVALLHAMAGRLVDALLVMTAHKRRGDASEELSPLVMPALAIATALADLLKAATDETGGDERPRAGFPQLTQNLRAMADLLDSMTPHEQR